MAYVQGYPGKDLRDTAVRHLFLMGIVAAVMIGMMLTFSPDWKNELFPILGIGIFCTILIAFVSSRLNPMALKMIFNRSEFEKRLDEDRAVADILGSLPDRYFVFHSLILELFRIEHLVVCPNGIFVIGTIQKKGALSLDSGTLFAGGKTLETVTGNLWRVCHLINIIVKKGYKTDIMPVPLLITRSDQLSTVSYFDGIALLAKEELKGAIEDDSRDPLEEELVESIASFLLNRYSR